MNSADMLRAALLGGCIFGTCGTMFGNIIGYERGRVVGVAVTNTARDKAHYEACKIVRAFTPKNSPAVECYVCPGATDEECLVPSWKGAP